MSRKSIFAYYFHNNKIIAIVKYFAINTHIKRKRTNRANGTKVCKSNWEIAFSFQRKETQTFPLPIDIVKVSDGKMLSTLQSQTIQTTLEKEKTKE